MKALKKRPLSKVNVPNPKIIADVSISPNVTARIV
jgi:hypothetical protein